MPPPRLPPTPLRRAVVAAAPAADSLWCNLAPRLLCSRFCVGVVKIAEMMDDAAFAYSDTRNWVNRNKRKVCGGGALTKRKNVRSANGSRRKAARAAVIARGDPCWICGLPINYSLPAGNPEAAEVDELVPVSLGGSPYDQHNLAAAHRCCNCWRSNRSVAYVNVAKTAIARDFGWCTPAQFVRLAKAYEVKTKWTRHGVWPTVADW